MLHRFGAFPRDAHRVILARVVPEDDVGCSLRIAHLLHWNPGKVIHCCRSFARDEVDVELLWRQDNSIWTLSAVAATLSLSPYLSLSLSLSSLSLFSLYTRVLL